MRGQAGGAGGVGGAGASRPGRHLAGRSVPERITVSKPQMHVFVDAG